MGGLLFLALRHTRRRKELAAHAARIAGSPKVTVYVAGSGAKGLVNTFRRLEGRLRESPRLLVVANPPQSAFPRGGVVTSPVTMLVHPVMDAQGTMAGAKAAREVEGASVEEAHRRFGEAFGASNTRLEMYLLHLGRGHTSQSVTQSWREHRTAGVFGASPARHVIVVRDSPVLQPQEGQSRTAPAAAESEGVHDTPTALVESASAPSPVSMPESLGLSIEALGESVVSLIGDVPSCGLVYSRQGFIVAPSQSLRGSVSGVRTEQGTFLDCTEVGSDPQSGITALRCARWMDAPALDLVKVSAAAAGDKVVVLGRGDHGLPLAQSSHVVAVLGARIKLADAVGLPGSLVVTHDGLVCGMITTPGQAVAASEVTAALRRIHS